MGRLKQLLLALALAALAAATLSACGSEKADLLPGETASEINANLDLVEQLVADGDCVGAANAAATVGEQVEGLTGIDKDLKAALDEGANRLNEVIVECSETSEEEDTAADEEAAGELEEDERAGEEKAEDKAAKDEEKAQKKEEKTEKEAPPTEPPGQEKKEEKEESEAPPVEPEDGGTPSGGVAPSTPAGAE
jgi:hypothetical protein